VSNWTEDQLKAIVSRGSNILVAAAAGSGKTAVLVERIIRMIGDEQNPVDVDRLLVSTFTNAAAAEMRQRIREALEERLYQSPNSEHLRRQLALIHRAPITTLHSFCLDVIRTHFQYLDLDPSFRIANDTEAELMRLDVLEECMEEQYGAAGEDALVWQLADWFGGEKSDQALYALVLNLYDFSRSHPWPEQWLQEMADAFNVSKEDHETLNDRWLRSLQDGIGLELDGAYDLLRQASQLVMLPGGPAAYQDNLAEDLILVEHLKEVALRHSWEHLYHAFQASGFGRLKSCRGDDIDKQLQEQVQSLRNQAKDIVSSIKEQLFSCELSTYIADLNRMAPLMGELVRLVNLFADRYRQAKLAKGLVDFADLEHYCLKILLAPESSPKLIIPSSAAMEYQEHFEEVLLDEYQDINAVQETIVSLISKDSGNRFMVGDVKQSIYRFRLAEPGLFLDKYKRYGHNDDSGREGIRIDLARNFRSRKPVLDAVNFVFRQLMHGSVAEMTYEERAELVYGANYPDMKGGGAKNEPSVEVMLIDRSPDAPVEQEDMIAGSEERENEADGDLMEREEQDMETARLEARFIAEKIRDLIGNDSKPYMVCDNKTKNWRPLIYRDIVILLRATQQWAPLIIDELRMSGIPAYAELSTGYFTAVEVENMLSLLKIIDNPYQDIPLAAVLRSPMFQISAKELAEIRICAKDEHFYDALLTYAGHTDEVNAELKEKLACFLEQLHLWRTAARQGALADLIWRIYRDTGYFDFVGGLPGGGQRQANLRALYDRARQYEKTSFRGLFRFLRFIERMRDSGGDLGTARALGEQEDVVRIMSIHKSKGLEFPVVFVAGMAKQFNERDLRSNFLLHKRLGFGSRFIDTEKRVSYPTLPFIAIQRRMRMEMLAEEMRVLYVALTRAKEKLYLVAAVKDLDKRLQICGQYAGLSDWPLPAYALARAKCYLDWLGPALIRHKNTEALRNHARLYSSVFEGISNDPSLWKVNIISSHSLNQAAVAQASAEEETVAAVRRAEPLQIEDRDATVEETSEAQRELDRRFLWQYEYEQAQAIFAKTTVTEMKKVLEDGFESHSLLDAVTPPKHSMLRRPRFMEAKKASPTERGVAYHAVMQHLPLDGVLDERAILSSIAGMIERQLLTEELSKEIDVSVIASFFSGPLGQRMQRSGNIRREVPFSYGLPAREAYPWVKDKVAEEIVLIQGVVDCIFDETDGLVLIDYKTDRVDGNSLKQISDRYRVQIDIYTKALENIWKKPVKEAYLFLFNGAHEIRMK
jgi:ATP-dependent helicase/nuclease subunit A